MTRRANKQSLNYPKVSQKPFTKELVHMQAPTSQTGKLAELEESSKVKNK